MSAAISVIVPVYNTAEFLPHCLGSILTQSFRKIEVVCVNDGSTDGSTEILREAAAADSRVRLIEQENRGAGAAKNRALESASGELLCVVDSDDLLLPEALAVLHEALDANVDIVHGSYAVTRPRSRRNRMRRSDLRTLTGPDCLAALISSEIRHDPWAKLFRRSLFADHQLQWPESLRCTTDLLIVYQAFHFARSVRTIPDPVYNYRKRPGSLQRGGAAATFVSDCIAAYRSVLDFLRAQGVWETHADRLNLLGNRVFQRLVDHSIRTGAAPSSRRFADVLAAYNEGLPQFRLAPAAAADTFFSGLALRYAGILSASTGDRTALATRLQEFLDSIDAGQLAAVPTAVVDELRGHSPDDVNWYRIVRHLWQVKGMDVPAVDRLAVRAREILVALRGRKPRRG